MEVATCFEVKPVERFIICMKRLRASPGLRLARANLHRVNAAYMAHIASCSRVLLDELTMEQVA
jgi:hypothetical protein